MTKKLLCFYIICLCFIAGCKKNQSTLTNSTETVEPSEIVKKTLEANKTGLTVGYIRGINSLINTFFFENKIDSKNISFKMLQFDDKAGLLSALLKNQINIAVFDIADTQKINLILPSSLSILCTLGYENINLLTTDNTYSSLSSLIDKDVYLCEEGSYIDIFFKSLLKRNSIPCSADDEAGRVHLKYGISAAEISGKLYDGKIEYAVLDCVLSGIALSKKSALIKKIDLLKDYYLLNKNSIAEYVVLTNPSYAKSHPNAVFFYLDKIKEGANWIKDNKNMTLISCQKNGIFVTKQNAVSAFDNFNLVIEDGENCKKTVNDFLDFCDLEQFSPSLFYSF